VGLSGGIDSALVAAIATDALGAENVVCIGMPSRTLRPAPSTTAAGWLPTLASVLK